MSAPSAVITGRSKYETILDDAWAAHVAERAPDAPTVISTFAGCGGSALGYSMAGFRDLLAVEWDAAAAETYRWNFPGVPIYEGDITDCTAEYVLGRTELAVGALDVLDGSPPCQGFSTAGQRILDDPRNSLFREYVRLLRDLKPKTFVLENVSGMVKGRMKLVFAEIMRELKASGYRVEARLLNAMYFHVPQARQRVIIVGVRHDIDPGGPLHPKAAARPIISRLALAGVQNKTFGVLRDNLAAQRVKAAIPKVRSGSNHASSTRSNLGFNLGRLHAEKPSPTIVREISIAGRYAGLIHYDEDRYITVEECKRLGSFPDQFTFPEDYTTAWQQIGNSVPPLLMRAIAGHIRENILEVR